LCGFGFAFRVHERSSVWTHRDVALSTDEHIAIAAAEFDFDRNHFVLLTAYLDRDCHVRVLNWKVRCAQHIEDSDSAGLPVFAGERVIADVQVFHFRHKLDSEGPLRRTQSAR
jgi:hypothetical protein